MSIGHVLEMPADEFSWASCIANSSKKVPLPQKHPKVCRANVVINVLVDSVKDFLRK